MSQTQKLYLGKILIDARLITQEQLEIAIEKQNTTGEKLGNLLIHLGFVEEEKLLEFLSQQLNIPYVSLENYPLKKETVQKLPEFYARRFRILLLNEASDGVTVGMTDPLDVLACDEMRKQFKCPIKTVLVRENELLKVIDLMYRQDVEISTLAEELSLELGQNNFDMEELTTGLPLADAPVVKLLKSIFEDAVKVNASDIHIEPGEKELRIRQRIDGVLYENIMKEKHIASALALRLKIMASLNIAEKRLPQDGRFSLKIWDKNFDVRLSTLPTQYGESVVIRLLNQTAGLLHLDQIGLPEDILTALRRGFSFPNGLLIVTGPTGSGKTTTLYSILNELNSVEKKIITVEDPIEYRLPRINQVQVQPKIDLTFSQVLRSVLRQDPDIIMVGEMRDSETVSIAMRAAMTGHLVLSSLHTNDSVSSISRLLHMEAEHFIIATVLRGVLAQRLVRQICIHCVDNYSPTQKEIAFLNSAKGAILKEAPLKYGKGCAYCHHTGYKGRLGIFEYLEMTPPLIEAIKNKKTDELDRIAAEDPHFETLLSRGLKWVAKGKTTISEILRVIGEG